MTKYECMNKHWNYCKGDCHDCMLSPHGHKGVSGPEGIGGIPFESKKQDQDDITENIQHNTMMSCLML